MPIDTSWPVRPISTWRLIAIIAVPVAAVVGYVAAGMPGMGHGTGDSHPLVELSPTRFETALEADDALVINVDQSGEGEIAGTHLFLPFDEVAASAALPADRDAPILLYSRTGRMSEVAGHALVDAGYRNVVHLVGGTDAWVASSRRLSTG